MAMLLAARARTSLAIAGAAGTIALALVMHHRAAPAPIDRGSYCEDGICVEARLASAILPGAMDHDVAITITAPRAVGERAPLSLAIVIDRSGSMGGKPLIDAKRAATRLVDQLAPTDAFSIVTYSSADETVAPMAIATEAAKQRARAAIEMIVDEGGTCISCGLDRGNAELAASPIRGGLRRMVVISDGQANEGIWNRDELAEHAATTALTGISISSVGVGLDFDEVTMVRLANVARGNYYFVEDTSGLDAMFARELGGLDDTIATNARLVLTATPHARITDAYGYPLGHVGEQVIIPVSDLRAGETRKVVVRMHVTPTEGAAVPLAKVELGWTSPASNTLRRAGTQAIAELVEDAADLVVDPSTLAAIEAARTARALEEAGNVYELHGAEAARQVLELRAGAISPHLDAASVDHEHQLNEAALELLRSAPASKVKKTFSETAYKLAR